MIRSGPDSTPLAAPSAPLHESDEQPSRSESRSPPVFQTFHPSGQKSTNESPYLREQRLPDVIAALQLLGREKDYDLTAEKILEKMAFKPRSATSWNEILDEHREFFRQSVEGKDYSLILRRAKEKINNIRSPLTEAEMSLLFNTAIHLQKHALEMQREKRAWYPIILTAVGILATIVGTLVGAALKSGS